MQNRLFHFAAAVFFTLFLGWACGYMLFSLSAITSKAQEPGRKTDAIVVLTGGPERINTGLDLLHQNMADQLFISGVHPKVSVDDLLARWPDAAEKKKGLCCITLGYNADNTEGNAREAGAWIRENDIRSIRLITSNYHMPRARLEFGTHLGSVSILSTPVQTPAGSKKFWSLSFGEYNKTILTWLRLHTGRFSRNAAK